MKITETQAEPKWGLWAEFCNKTRRETRWALRIGKELVARNILPCRLALDVGCGTGEFTSVLSAFTPHVKGIDKVDIRGGNSFDFAQVDFESYRDEKPDVLLFKQSFHLLENADDVPFLFSECALVIAQMPKPDWDTSPNWDRRPLNARLNAEALKRSGRPTEIVRMEQRYNIGLDLLRRMFLEGYTSDLQKLDSLTRTSIWESLRPLYESGCPYTDVLDLIVALPPTPHASIPRNLPRHPQNFRVSHLPPT